MNALFLLYCCMCSWLPCNNEPSGQKKTVIMNIPLENRQGYLIVKNAYFKTIASKSSKFGLSDENCYASNCCVGSKIKIYDNPQEWIQGNCNETQLKECTHVLVHEETGAVFLAVCVQLQECAEELYEVCFKQGYFIGNNKGLKDGKTTRQTENSENRPKI